ncbi:MAG: TonB-dependent receptor [Acidobacteria bacterium]|nr:TonB-dependent receptor [Acidobacteriota bacterium]MBI3664283.1 TonB-dependent receptor [Acidobacteriota bacterium]
MMRREAWGVFVRAALAYAALLALLLTPAVTAQTFRGTILGTVSDQSGAVVPGAKVKVRNVDTGLVRETQTAGDGSYSVPELPIGNYSVTVEKAGFQTTVTSGVRVEVAADKRVDATLKAGDVKVQVEVSAETLAQVETTSNVLGGSFESKMMLDLPVNGRDYTKLLIMVPGAAGEPNGGGDSPGSFGLFSVNGNRGRSNNFLLDGTDMNDGFRNLPAINQGGVFGTPGTVLPMEAVAELKVLSNFEPEYGRNSGSVVNIVTKTGTNTIHGTALWFFRDDTLNARNFFNTKGNPKDAFRNHQYGISAGGPLEKDKTFWYVAYEGQREDVGVTSINAVPVLADFRNALNQTLAGSLPGGNPAVCNTTIIACINGQAPGVINPVIKNLFNLCDTNGHCSGGKNLWPTSTVSSAPAFNNADSFIFKLDHSFDDKSQLTGRYFFGRSHQSFPLGLAGGNNLPATNTFSPINVQMVAISYVRVISANKVNELRFGWNRYHQDFLAEDRGVFGNPNSTFGLNTGISATRDFGLPELRVSGYSQLGSSGFSNPRGRVANNIHVIDGFSWKAGSHDWKFGYEFRRTTVDSFYDAQFRGRLSFKGGGDLDGPDTADTSPLADFLAGYVASSGKRIASGNTNRLATQNSHALYIQDSWRWSHNFTLNLGLRWDYFGVIGEEKGRFSTYDPAVGLVLKEKLYDKDFNNFSPRMSVAWDLFGKGKTVIRAGYGLFYDAFSQDFFTGQIFFNSFMPGIAYNAIGPDPVFFSFSLNPALPAVPNGSAFGRRLQAGVPVFDPATRIAAPTGSPTGTTDAATVGKIRTPYIHNFNLNLQQEVGHYAVLQVGYVGSVGIKLFRFRDINQPTQAAINAADIACAGAGNPLGAACTFAPLNFTTVLSTLAPNSPLYVNQLETSATSHYHGLQTSFSQRNWRGLTQQLSWTWSHAIDTASDGQDYVPNAAQPNDSNNARAEKGNSNFDLRHRVVWSLTYELPKWETARWFGEGWQISSVMTLASGHPFHLNTNFFDDYDGSGEFFGRPDVVAPVKYNRSDPTNFLDLTSFAVPCTLSGGPDFPFAADCVAGTRHFGNLGRNSLLGPDYRNWDFAIIKVTKISERIKLHFRADFYNLLNHPNFASPLLPSFIADSTFNGVSDGVAPNPARGRGLGSLPITATSDVGLGNPILGGGGPRSIQFAVKVLF